MGDNAGREDDEVDGEVRHVLPDPIGDNLRELELAK